MTTTTEMEEKRKKYTTWAMWGLGLGILAITGPIIFMAIKGLAALLVFGAVSVVALNVAPVLAMKAANWKIAGIKAEAAANPIETLHNIRIEKQDQLQKGWEALKMVKAAVRTFQDKVDSFRAKFGNNDPQTEKFAAQLETMRHVEAQTAEKMNRAQSALVLFDREIERATAIWDVSQAGQAATKAAKMNSADIYEKIKADTAIDSVQLSLNTVFAELETSMSEDAFKMALEGPKYETNNQERQQVKAVSRVYDER